MGTLGGQTFFRPVESIDPTGGLVGIAVETHTVGTASASIAGRTAVNFHVEGKRRATDAFTFPETAEGVLRAVVERPEFGALALTDRGCPGDCNLDSEVSLAELTRAVGIALGRGTLEGCPAADADADGILDIDDLLESVTSSIEGCVVPPPPNPGPELTFIGIARADDVALEPDEIDSDGRPVYVRPYGHGFSLVVEARRGASRRQVGRTTFLHDPDDPSVLPDLQMIVSRPLGNGSAEVCDTEAPAIGGIPPVPDLDFGPTQAVADAINDLGCRADDGRGMPRAHAGCIKSDRPAVPTRVLEESEAQFCLPIARAWSFPAGETIIAARVRDSSGNVGQPRQMVIRVLGLR